MTGQTTRTYHSDGVKIAERLLCYADDDAQPPSVAEELALRGEQSHDFEGTYLRFGLRPGFSLSTCDARARRDFLGTGSCAAGLSLTVMLDGSGGGWLTEPLELGQNNPVAYAPATTFVYYTEFQTKGRYRADEGARFLTVELRLDSDFLGRYDGARKLLTSLGGAHPMTRLHAPGIWIGAETSSAAAQASARRIIDLSRTDVGGCRDGEMEARALDIFTDLMQRLSAPAPQRRRASLRDAPILVRLRDDLLKHPERPWPLEQLAQQAGMSLTRLKSGFHAEFGVPIHAFLQRARIERACDMLARDPHRSITEVSLAVGYANPSHFAQMFRKATGLPPSAFAERIHYKI